jgi:hypothetical protein
LDALHKLTVGDDGRTRAFPPFVSPLKKIRKTLSVAENPSALNDRTGAG